MTNNGGSDNILCCQRYGVEKCVRDENHVEEWSGIDTNYSG